MLNNNKDELYHFGVKGMKWGQRRAIKAVDKYTKKSQRQYDAHMNSAKYIKKILDSGYDVATEERLTKDDRNQYTYEYKRTVQMAKKWLAARNDIMKMDISTITAKAVEKKFKNVKSNASYYPFA